LHPVSPASRPAPDPSGRLYLLPVPLADDAGDTLPAATVAVARRLDYFLVENARSARAALQALGHPRPMATLDLVQIGHQPQAADAEKWLAPIRAGRDGAVMSEAGCPGVADPGEVLVAAAHRCGVPVVPLVGPSAILLALMAAGGNGQCFRFAGYLPQDRAALAGALADLERRTRLGETQVVIETPYRNVRLLEAICASCADDTALTVAVDLTGSHQQIQAGTVAQWRTGRIVAPPLQRRPAVFVFTARRGR
jgi:16S rRNA (cytidine1402-2'-O)-methyltransferase